MYKKTQYLVVCSWLLFFFGFSSNLEGHTQTLLIDEQFYQTELNDWIDLRDKVSFQKELASTFSPENGQFSDNWQSLPKQSPIKWKENLWLKLPLKNTTNQSLDLILLLHADLLDVWYEDESNSWQHQQGGNLKPRKNWDSQQHQPEYSSPHTIQFSIPSERVTTLFIKVGPTDGNSSLLPRLCNRPFFLTHSTHYFQRTIATQSFFHGVLLIMLLFPFGMYLLNKEKAYLYYAGYTLTISIFLGYAFEFQNFSFLANYPRFGRVLANLCNYGFPFFYNLFLIHFLHSNNWRLDIKKRIQQFNYLLLIWGGLTSFLLIILSPASFKLIYNSWLNSPVSIIGLGGLFWLSWQYWKSNNKLARFVAANNLFMLLGLVVSFIIFYVGAIGLVDGRTTSFWGILFLEGTIILQLLSFSLSLSYKGLETERERVKLKELDSLKSKFFANISHEFRTPLTLILGPVQQLQAKTTNTADQQQLRIAEKYAQSLLRLVNQILDLTKMEVGKMQLETSIFDWIQVGKVITYSFASAAAQKEIKLDFVSNHSELLVTLDQSKIEQILINLIANALKFTPEGGKIEVLTKLLNRDNVLQITVKDNGIGISEEQQKYIFQHFYQADHGDFTVDQPSSGIGLALTKELVGLHKGTIQVKSQHGKGTSFIINIPLSNSPTNIASTDIQDNTANDIILPTLATTAPLESTTTLVKDTANKPIILIIEDHPDIQQYIQSCLIKDYQLITAKDGEAGIQQAIEQVPDIVITDVMMPKKDGFEVTQTLKQHAATSHIPIIILTGKSSKKSKMTGLQSAADDYLTKPFDADELRLRIKNLLDNRQKWVQHFQKSATAGEPTLALPSIEDVFIQKALKIVENNLGDENFSVEKLGRALHLDRTQLFRKLKTITGQNPSNFIRTVRLKKAYHLLANRTATVGEVAFSVGFSSTTYFNRCFKTQFGKTPGAVLNR